MLKYKQNLNKLHILVLALFFIVIGQFIYLAQLYANNTNDSGKSIKIPQPQAQNLQSKKPVSIFDDFDNEFMSQHFQEVRKIKEQMDKVFQEASAEFNRHIGFNDEFHEIFGSSTINNNLNLDLKNEPNQFIVTLKLPNSQKNNINVQLENQKLIISGDAKEQIEETNSEGKQYKAYSSKFTRSIILPEKVQENSLTTKYKNDKLIITILKENTV